MSASNIVRLVPPDEVEQAKIEAREKFERLAAFRGIAARYLPSDGFGSHVQWRDD